VPPQRLAAHQFRGVLLPLQFQFASGLELPPLGFCRQPPASAAGSPPASALQVSEWRSPAFRQRLQLVSLMEIVECLAIRRGLSRLT
jgi:hypothetical protein